MAAKETSIKIRKTFEHSDAHKQLDYLAELESLKEALKFARSTYEFVSIYDRIGMAYYRLGRTAEAKENYVLALENISSLSNKEAKEFEWSLNDDLGNVFYDEGDYANSLFYKIKALRYVDSLQPQDAFLLLLSIGANYEKLEEYDKAIEFHLKSLEVSDVTNEDKAMIFQFIGQCYDSKDNRKKAFNYWQKMFSIDPDYDAWWYVVFRFAQLAYRFNNYEVSIEYFKNVITQIPSDQNGYLQSLHQHLGYNYLAKKEFKSALVEFNKSLEIKKDSSEIRAEIYCGISQAYFGLNKIRKTIKFALKALNEQFNEVVGERIYFLLAYAYSLQGNEKKEDFYTEKLRKLKPNSGYLRELMYS